MALIECKECGKQVSSKARECPSCGAVINKPKRGFFGTLFLWLFILFNILMVAWLISYWNQIGGSLTSGTEAEQAGTAIGGTIGTGMLMVVWALGDIILGLLALLTRAK